jgi:hypothetical protein
MKKTAVEWLIEQCPRIETIVAYNILEQAKAMEKEQMALCYKVGVIDGNNGEVLNFEEYYNQTYKQVTNKN